MKAHCECCGSRTEVSLRPGNDAKSGKPFEDLCCDQCNFVIATLSDCLPGFTLEFRPADEVPTMPEGESFPAALLYNQCDGYHHVFARFYDDGTFDGFYNFLGTSEYTKDAYSAWALLPDGENLYRTFARTALAGAERGKL